MDENFDYRERKIRERALDAFDDWWNETTDPIMKTRPTIVCLCGSTRFSEAFQRANLNETLAGRIVLTIGCDMRSDAAVFADYSEQELARVKLDLDELHKRKIDLADEILVLNVDGYIGQSTRSEIEYAQSHRKGIRYLEPIG